jgi:ElaB/YqjD/DUF883 family membrane-anchored ribosome-binding protein
VAQERDPLVTPVTPRVSPLTPDLPVATPASGSDVGDVAEPGFVATGAMAGSTMGSAIDTPAGAGMGQPGAAASGPPATAGSDKPEQIREQIGRTREDMSQTLNELQQRLSPQHLAQQARESVREATVGRVHHLVESAGDTASHVAVRAQDAAGSVVEQVREHPVPVALAGAGAGLVWWLMRRSSSRQTWSSENMYDWDDANVTYERDMMSLDIDSDDGSTRRRSAWMGGTPGWARVLREHPVPASIAAACIGYLLWNRRAATDDYMTPSEARAYTGATPGTTARVADTAKEMTRLARERAAGMGEQMSESVRHAQERATEVTHDVQRRIRSAGARTTSQLERWLHDNPMAVGIAALAAGAVVGLAVPRSRTEDSYLGSSRDALVDRASDTAQQLKEQVRDKVQEVAHDLANEMNTGTSTPPASSRV